MRGSSTAMLYVNATHYVDSVFSSWSVKCFDLVHCCGGALGPRVYKSTLLMPLPILSSTVKVVFVGFHKSVADITGAIIPFYGLYCNTSPIVLDTTHYIKKSLVIILAHHWVRLCMVRL